MRVCGCLCPRVNACARACVHMLFYFVISAEIVICFEAIFLLRTINYSLILT